MVLAVVMLSVYLLLWDNPSLILLHGRLQASYIILRRGFKIRFHYITVQQKVPKSEVKVPHKTSMAK